MQAIVSSSTAISNIVPLGGIAGAFTQGGSVSVLFKNSPGTGTVTGNSTWIGSRGSVSYFLDDELVAVINRLAPGATYDMPDGSKLILDKLGNYRIEDKDAKVTYAANRNRDFNPFVNASDMLADYVRDLGALGLTAEQIMATPIDLFVHWLVVSAAERDEEKIDGRCRTCGRYLPKPKRRVGACSVGHLPRIAA